MPRLGEGFPVHPHACGELRARAPRTVQYTGSSPRMWGTLCVILDQFGVDRFIPTHVGNSKSISDKIVPSAVHPHACGELPISIIVDGDYAGSSPRMWGTRQVLVSVILFLRFIPTHVGNSDPAHHRSTPGPVHPHACGELAGVARAKATPHGSSPRMWGTRIG